MLAIPVSFVDKNIYAYEQTCKRARNIFEAIISKRYIISEKKFFRTVHYEVNVLGEINKKFGKTPKLLEYMLDMDHISASDYQLLKFYDLSGAIDKVIEIVKSRRKEDDTIEVTMEEMQLLYDIGTFQEDPLLTKEEILSGEQL